VEENAILLFRSTCSLGRAKGCQAEKYRIPGRDEKGQPCPWDGKGVA